MKSFKQVIALMLALMLVMTPVNSVFATGTDVSEPAIGVEEVTDPSEEVGYETEPSEGNTDPGGDSGSSEPTDPSTEPSEPGTDPSEPETEPTEPVTSEINISFEYSEDVSESGWYTVSGGLSVVFRNTIAFEEVTLSYAKGTDEPTDVNVVSKEDGSYFGEVPSLEDGIYTFTAYAKGTDGIECSKTFELKLDTKGVDFSEVSANGLTVHNDGIAYAKDKVVLNGFKDKTSGIKSIITMNGSEAVAEYSAGDAIEVTSDVTSIVLVDNAGNSSDVTLQEVTAHICSDVVFDSGIPTISISKQSESVYNYDSKEYYNGKFTMLVTVEDDNLNEVVAYVDGSLLGNSVILGSKVTLAYSFEESKEYVVEITVTDKAGNFVTETVSFVVDIEPPKQNSLKLTGSWVEAGGKLYAPSALAIEGTAEDSLSGVSSIEVIKNGEVVSTTLPYSIVESGEYSVKVYDNVGNFSEFSLENLSGVSVSKVIIDSDCPNVSVNLDASTTPSYSGSRGYWYTSNPVVNVTAKDDNIKSVSIILIVDGEEVTIRNSNESLNALNVSTAEYEGKAFTLRVTAEDFSGNSNSAEYTYNVDKSAPYSISVSAPTPSTEKCGNVYFTETFDVVITAEDDGFGELVYYLDDVSNNTGVFTGVGAGKHYVKVADGLGNIVEAKSLSDYLGWSGNTVVVVTDTPSIDATGFAGAWVSSVPAYVLNTSDSFGIDYYSVEVNGSVIEKSYNDVNTHSAVISFNLVNVEGRENGAYSVKVVVRNNAGLVSEWTDTVNVDLTAPDLGSITCQGNWNEVDGEVFSSNAIVISGTAHDAQSGVASVVVFKNGSEVSNFLPYSIVESGSYLIKITDGVGNSNTYTIKDLLGTTSNNIVIDSEIPNVGFDSSTTTPTVVHDGVNWFKNYPTISVNASDSNRIYVEVIVNSDGVNYTDYSGHISGEFQYNIDTGKYSGKKYTITVSATDDSGNTYSTMYSFSVDMFKPEKSGLSVTAEYVDTENTAFTSKSFVFAGKASDSDSGISSLVIYKDGFKCYESADGSMNYTASSALDSGSYVIVVTDRVGNSLTIQAKDLLGSASNDFVVDKDIPVISRVDSEVETSFGWYNYVPVLKFKVEDTYIKSYVVTVNGAVVREGSVSEEFQLDMSAYKDMVVNVKIYVKDFAGNSSEYNYSYHHDGTAPSDVSANSSTNYVEKEGFVYFTDELVIQLSANDFGYGNLTYYLNEVSNQSGEFTINSNGEYYVVVADGLSNKSNLVSLAELLDWSSNSVIFDSGKPTITAYKYNSQWVSKAPVYTFGFSDNYGIDTIVITVNGVELYNKKYTIVNATNESASVNLADSVVNPDGSYNVSVSVTDNSGLVTTWSDVVYLDDTAPVVDNFEIIGATNVFGSTVNGSDSYGFFFDGNGKITVIVSDSGATSGIKSIWTRLEGYEWVEHKLISNNTVEVVIPADFKGKLEAYAVDNVGNIGAINMPDLLVSESEETHENSSNLVITLPNTPYTDKNDLPLYNSDITVSVIAGCSTSGFSYMEWGVDEVNQLISSLTGTSYDKNLITEITQGLGIVGNENGMRVIVRVTDMVGHTSEGYKTFSIDKDKPVIEVVFDSTTQNGHYKVTRTATIKVTERNFDPDLFTVSGVSGELGSWSNNGGVWTNTINFVDNGEYQFILNCTDMAGNEAVQYKSEEFVVDKTAPVLERVDTNVESAAGWYNYTPELQFKVSESYVDWYEVFINGTVVSEGVGHDITVDTSNYTNMSVTVIVKVADSAGNSDEYTYSYRHDNKAPVNIGVVADTPATQKDGTVYFNGQFDIIVSSEDAGYGDITYYLNGVANKDGRFTITESGEYFVKVVDGLGHESASVELGSYCGWVGNSVIINNTVPIVKWDTYNGVWIDGTSIYDVDVNSSVGIDSIVAIVNGVEVVKNNYSGLDTASTSVRVDISKAVMAADSSYKTVITVTDNSGMVTVVEDIVYVDLNVAGMGSMKVDGNWEIHGGKLYTKGAITINGYPEDTESGIASVVVLKNGESVGSLPYTITSSGVYEVVVTDKVGNQVSYTFADIAGVSTSDIVWDDTYPAVYFDMDKSDKHQYVDGNVIWYANNPTIYIDMTDTNMKSVSVVVTIDGVQTVVVDDIIEEGIYAINTAYSKGSHFKIVATAKDKSGNVSEASYEFRVDTSAPSKGSLSVSATPEWVEIGDAVYIRGQFTISGFPVDTDSGIKSVKVYYSQTDSGAVAAEEYMGAINIVGSTENMSGFYYIEVIDNVGNVYKVRANELLGSTSNNFIVDLTAPTIERTDDNVETKSGWFNYSPVFTFDINDTYIKEYVVYVNGNIVLTGDVSESISVDTSKYKNQKVTIHIKVTDKAGNTFEYSYSYEHDDTPPDNVSIEMANPVTMKGDNVYYNGSVDLVITSADSAYGNISYYINGTRVNDGMYTVVKSGEYEFEVVDGLGNSTGVMTLKEFLNWSGNNIVIDSSNPVIESVKYNNAWIKGVGSYTISISDNLGIHSIVATVNGVKVVDINTVVTDDIDELIEINTTMAELNDDGSFKTVVTVIDNAGLVTTWEDVVYVDNTAPVVDKFIVYGDVHRLGTEDAYGYFFNGNGVIEIVCSDANPSSGLKSVWVKLDGYDWAELDVNETGVVTIQVPENFKGSIEAYAVDKVGNVGETKSPAKLISETVENHVKNQKIEITLPDTPYTDVSGLPLYNTDIIADLLIGCDWSGLQYMEWGTDSMTTVSDFSNGVFDENIVVQYGQKLPMTGNENGLVLTVNVADWADHLFSKEVSFSIDKDVPVISVVFDSAIENGYYKDTRVATITVTERNFDPAQFVIGGSYGSLGTWSNDGDIWTNTITFSKDNDYKFTLDCTDRAGNVATQYVSEEFTVDKTLPVMSVTWNNNSFENGIYYKSGRLATITVVEHNFDSSLFTLTGSGSLSNWASNGDTHVATVKFDSDGEYDFSINGYDLAGNVVEEGYISGKFIVDLTAPVIVIERVSEGVSYKSDVEFIVTVSDTYINENTKVYLSGKRHEEVEVSGQFVGQTGTFSYTDFPKNEDIDDVYMIRVVSVDHAGNVSEDSLVFSINRFGSSYSFYDADYLGNYLGESKDIEISEVNVDKLDVNKVVVSITRDGKEIEVNESWVRISESEVDSKYLYKYFISKEAFTEDGKYSVTVMSEAEEGTKYTCASEQYDFIVDKSEPVVIISGVEEGKDYREYNRTIAVDIRDLSGIKSLKFYVNGEEVTDYTENDGIYSLVIGESSDVQSVTVEVIDKAGNKTTATVDSFLITSNLMVYLINQIWFLALIAFILFVIIVMIILLLLGRRKDKDDEKAALAASGELYRSSTAGSVSSGTTGGTTGSENQILSGDEPTVDNTPVVGDDVSTSVMDDDSDATSTGFMNDESDGNTGVM